MSRLAALFLVPLVCLMALACRDDIKRGAREQRPTTRLVARVARATWPAGAPIVAELTIYNGERYDLYVNKRMAVTPDLPPIFGGEVRPEVREVATGHLSLFRCSLDRVPEGQDKDHVVLRPGQSVSAKVSTDCYDTRRPGRYSLVFHYRDTDRARSADAIHLTRELVSDPVEVEVLPGDGGAPPPGHEQVPRGYRPI